MRTSDAARVEAAYRATHRRLWRALLVWSGRPDVATDAEAEAFAQVCGRAADVENIEAWVWRAAFRIAAGLLAERPTPPDERPTTIDPVPVEAFELAEALAELTELQRQCVVLRHVGGFSSAQIAEQLDSTPASVRVQIHRGLNRLRQIMEPNT
ncbi:MAG: sigma factor-like helix-turn-helix DNA-binding protein [Actinomycetota bacterium]|nr:sigma factor-like helix-turn-helix DNA-binding protein [Actinomycetota bacterium]